ncbi:MAG TPA: amino acid ABC transporter substrate-binding protein [Burkholderiaceae bacterium]
MRTCHWRPRIAAALIAMTVVAPAVQAAETTLDRIRQTGHLVIGYRSSSVPLSYLVDGKPVGYSIDVCLKMADAITRELGLKSLAIDYREVSSASRLPAVQGGLVDLECGSTTNTAQRRELVAFTISHFIATSRLLVRSADPFEKLEDLDGRKVASTAGTTNIASLKREAELRGVKLEVPEARDHAQAVKWVIERRVDAFAMDDVLLFGLRATSPRPAELKVIGKPMTIEPYSIAFARGEPQLKRLADATLRQLIVSGELRRMYDRWFMHPIPPNGATLDMPPSALLLDSWHYPSDFVPG